MVSHLLHHYTCLTCSPFCNSLFIFIRTYKHGTSKIIPAHEGGRQRGPNCVQYIDYKNISKEETLVDVSEECAIGTRETFASFDAVDI